VLYALDISGLARRCGGRAGRPFHLDWSLRTETCGRMHLPRDCGDRSAVRCRSRSCCLALVWGSGPFCLQRVPPSGGLSIRRYFCRVAPIRTPPVRRAHRHLRAWGVCEISAEP